MVTYGRSVPSIADQLYGKRDDMTQEEKIKGAQKVYDSVMNNFPGLRAAMLGAQDQARKFGYTETILGRRRHIPDMQLPEFEFKAMPGYVNPDIDPLDPSTLTQKDEIPKRIVDALLKEFKSYKYFGQIVKRTKELAEEKIRVINNKHKINDASRQCLNCVDADTEILTLSGWKHYDEICVRPHGSAGAPVPAGPGRPPAPRGDRHQARVPQPPLHHPDRALSASPGEEDRRGGLLRLLRRGPGLIKKVSPCRRPSLTWEGRGFAGKCGWLAQEI